MPAAEALNAEVSGRVDRLALVMGDQLDQRSAVLEDLDPANDAVLMVEVEEESTHVPSHKQRTALFLAAMRHHALWLTDRGFRVRYIRLDSPGNTHSFSGEVERTIRRLKPESLRLLRPGEHRVMAMVDNWRAEYDLPVEVLEDTHFLTTPESFSSWADGRKRLVMEHFYRQKRREHGMLLDEHGGPVGGRWNYDAENRDTFKKSPKPPTPYRPRADALTQEVLELVEHRLPDNPGSTEGFAWPVTRRQALRALDDFVEHRLPHFGAYQDAMWSGQPWLYHSLLSPCLNLKLLHPMECVSAAVEAYEAGNAPLNAVEGFVRQIIGWREFIRGVYWHEGPGYARRNGLSQRGRLPDLYWTGETDMACMRACIGQVLAHGYGHHIQRLMVTGNFALIAGVHPKAISDWYLGMYVDAVDWVTLPNTLGMVMHADHGVVGTKPYAASGRYIERMSNYCAECGYDHGRRTGESACPFTTFYWDFLDRNKDVLKDNHRMRMILKNLDRFSGDQRAELTVSAQRIRRDLGIGAVSG